MRKTRNLCIVLLLLLFSIKSSAQKDMLNKLYKKTLKLSEVENYMELNDIPPAQCVDSKQVLNNDLDESGNIRYSNRRPSYEIKVFNVFFHVVNENNGNRAVPISENDLIEAVAILNKTFNQFKIFFKYKGHDQINSTWRSVLYIGGNRTFSQLVEYSKSIGKYQNNSFNVYIVSTIRYSQYDSRKIAGLSNKPGINSVIDDEYLLTSTLPHEIGHNFSLEHTYRNWNNSNCNLVAQNDYIDDTLPSMAYENSEIDSDCTTYIGDKDKNKCGIDFTQVPATNFMSSNVLPCRSLENASFTSGQGKRMMLTIQNKWNTIYKKVENSIESLYEPYQGSYVQGIYQDPNNVTGKEMKFQKGFDYQFVDCKKTTFVKKSYSKNDVPKEHPYFTAIKILQVSSSEARKCNIPRPSVYQGGTVISFGNIIDNNYEVKKLDSEEIQNPKLVETLPFGYSIINKELKNGDKYQKTIYKARN
ncbi:M43 family zinc metalloprotease [Tenacibaculum sp. E3R01]|uniref:M43 family zinc metalloprotease n=1 Tax=Tenacibaculum sp. E3R01 TaxID=2267227 RepID=UPI001313FDBC|nr:M43 family zinc metalloprotease [Tenacibaculum sp. E3R01]